MQALASYIVRPQREVYQIADLGHKQFSLGKTWYQRRDFQLVSIRGILQCSWFDSIKQDPKKCVIYCHGNCGCRIDSFDILEHILKHRMSLVCFDFGGCGLSEGDYVSLGFYEKNDIKTVVKYVQESGRATSIGIWGRSMGAVAAILYSESMANAPPLVLDSPFCCLNDVIDDMIGRYKLIPRILKDFILEKISKIIKDTALFDLENIKPLLVVKKCHNYAVFIHSFEDKLINYDHSQKLYQDWAGPKHFLTVNGHHNSLRDPTTILRALTLLESMMGIDPNDDDGSSTERRAPPEFSKKANRLIRHRRYQSEGDPKNFVSIK
ncbi:unnamed protein product [Blepharisma stoltei]|uniref:Serine aminopeptidase S33 domain-containing protein n=1 Tax=Blepharisma stoltei TaxID=1481888 RepID=A0AAU9J9R4_9CILI|nr:unnamed protein product [Blepharisma stoltei]